MSRNDKNNIGLAMYTVYQSVKKDMTASFTHLAQMGYSGIEFYGEPREFPKEEVCFALRESGLRLAGWHVEWRNLQEHFLGETVNYLHSVDCPIAIVPCLGGKWKVGHDSRQECRDRWRYYIENLNQINECLQKEGIRLGYHNHEHEFQLQYEGQSVFDLLYENLAPSVIMELDSGNCIEGGGNPLTVLQKYRNRQVILHLKPYSQVKGFDVILGEEGDDNNWQELLHQSEKDFLWLLIESENHTLPEMENARLCMEGLHKYL